VYKTSFTNSPYAYVEVAARAQKWFDQAISRNIYLETRDIDETMQVYNAAWEKGLKSTYYLHMKPRHNAEQSTTTVNKAAVIGKKGFGVLSGLSASAGFAKVAPAEPVASPIVVPSPVAVSVSAAVMPEVEATPVMPAVPVAAAVPAPQPVVAPAPVVAAAPAPAPASVGFANIRPAAPAEAPAPAKPKFNIIVSEDPSEANICDSCQ
jgi:ribonucleoside-diphosphate reductase alpha chain